MRELISPWKQHLLNFYEYKKLCGYKYTSSESVINRFDRYYYDLGIKELRFSRDIIESFLYMKEKERIGNQVAKASVLRQFGKYLFTNQIIDSTYIIPPISTKGEEQFIPYIYSNKELCNIISYLENYQSIVVAGGFDILPNTLNAVTTVIKILMATGMRLGEVIELKIQNIDFENNVLYIEVAKNDNQRIVPISDTLKKELYNYINNTCFILQDRDYLFYIDLNRRLKGCTVQHYFNKAVNNSIKDIHSKRMRLHDLRHTFAVMSLTQLQKNEEDINLSLSYLSTYLGHKSFVETQKYIWLTPILFKDIKDKMENFSSFIMDIFEGEHFDET